MKYKSKNVTFTLPVELIEKYKQYASSDLIPSINSGVKEALEAYCVRLDKEVLKREMMLAAADPLFMEDTEKTMKAFEFSDVEATQGGSEW